MLLSRSLVAARPDNDVNYFSGLVIYLDCPENCVDSFIILTIRCIPKKLMITSITCPLNNLADCASELEHFRLDHPMPDILSLLHLLQRKHQHDVDRDFSIIVSAEAVDRALFQAISTSNSDVLQALTTLPFTPDDEEDSETLLSLVRAEYFIAAAKHLDRTAMRTLYEASHSIFPFENEEILSWMQHEDVEARGKTCSCRAFVDYLKYVKTELDNDGSLDRLECWMHQDGAESRRCCSN